MVEGKPSVEPGGSAGHVLFLQGTSNFGGSKQSLLNVIDTLPSRHRPVVAVAEPGWLVDELDARRVPHVTLPFPAWRKLFGPWRLRSAIARQWLPALSPMRIACVYANEFPWSAHAVLAARALRCRSLVHLHGAYAAAKARKHLVHRLDAIVACSSEGREALRGLPEAFDKTGVVFYGLPERQFGSGTDREAGRAALGIPAGVLAIGNIGKLCERKNQRLLLAALGRAKAAQAIGPFRVFFAGAADMDYRRAMEADAARLNLSDEICYLGQIGDVGSLLASVDIVVHCATREGLAFAMIEGMAAGKPVVATQVEGTRDAIPDDGFGLVVPPGNADALAAAIAGLAADGQLRGSIGQRAKERALSHFRMAGFGERIAAILDRLVSSG
ncbi:MAG: glycosyltransferase family 4 protein [Bauldia sp.]